MDVGALQVGWGTGCNTDRGKWGLACCACGNGRQQEGTGPAGMDLGTLHIPAPPFQPLPPPHCPAPQPAHHCGGEFKVALIQVPWREDGVGGAVPQVHKRQAGGGRHAYELRAGAGERGGGVGEAQQCARHVGAVAIGVRLVAIGTVVPDLWGKGGGVRSGRQASAQSCRAGVKAQGCVHVCQGQMSLSSDHAACWAADAGRGTTLSSVPPCQL